MLATGDGTTHIVLEPVDLIARLAALVPPPRLHLTRFHGVLAAHAALRAAITRVFGIEIEQCVRCGGRLTVIATRLSQRYAGRRDRSARRRADLRRAGQLPPRRRLRVGRGRRSISRCCA